MSRRCRHWWRNRNNPRRKCLPCRRAEAKHLHAKADAWINSCEHDFVPGRPIAGHPADNCVKCPLVKLGPKPGATDGL